jgi:16S rRNA (cytidine1402-2'-O)-methyltransferase
VFVLYESPHRVVDLVGAISDKWPQCLLCVCSDLTKRFERIYRGESVQVLAQLRASPGVEKGEYCLAADISMVPPASAPVEKPPVEAWMLARMLDGAALAEAAEAAQAAGYTRNEVYRAKLRIADMFEEE